MQFSLIHCLIDCNSYTPEYILCAAECGPLNIGPMKGTYGLPPYAPINVTKSFGPNGNIDEGTLRAYAREKLMGHREYEETCK